METEFLRPFITLNYNIDIAISLNKNTGIFSLELIILKSVTKINKMNNFIKNIKGIPQNEDCTIFKGVKVIRIISSYLENRLVYSNFII